MGELVRATKKLFYGGNRINAGRTFSITEPSHFSATSMERVTDPNVPDDIAKATAASPKMRTEGGVELKQKRPGVSVAKGTLEPDPGI